MYCGRCGDLPSVDNAYKYLVFASPDVDLAVIYVVTPQYDVPVPFYYFAKHQMTMQPVKSSRQTPHSKSAWVTMDEQTGETTETFEEPKKTPWIAYGLGIAVVLGVSIYVIGKG